MPLDLLFRIACTIALARVDRRSRSRPLQRPLAVLSARLLAAVLCGGYVAVLVHALGHGPAPDWRAFNSLDGVIGLLRTREASLAGWVHYLAFDLFTGAWEAETAPAGARAARRAARLPVPDLHGRAGRTADLPADPRGAAAAARRR